MFIRAPPYLLKRVCADGTAILKGRVHLPMNVLAKGREMHQAPAELADFTFFLFAVSELTRLST